jgi:hypothetical protein
MVAPSWSQAYKEHSGNMKGTASEGTFGEHSGNIQGTFREHEGNMKGT